MTCSSTAFATSIFSIRQDTIRNDDASERKAWLLCAPDWVNVIAVTEGRLVVLVRQYRHGVGDVTLEIPGGAIDPGETPAQAAARELSEETGYASTQWSEIGVVAPNPAIQGNRTYTYLARDVRLEGAQHTDEHEEIEVLTAPYDDVLRMLRDGTISHSLVLCAFAHLMLKGEP